ncbi:nitronate monooxygenase [Rapidithrix thailandica]|uniref:Nitronate monooxygenase n=1 Tax=Rapidithrix thailandica TaxID=413964 RepID=A0AAW9SG88_9BACT
MKRRKFISMGAGMSSIATIGMACGKSPEGKTTLKTPLCDLLGIEYPIIQAGMGDVAGPELVAAVSNAGGLGILSGTLLEKKVLQGHIQKIRSLTERPFGVNLILQKDLFPPAQFDIPDETVRKVQTTLNQFRKDLGLEPSFAKPPQLPDLLAQDFEVILEENVPVWSVGLGNPPQEMVDRCKKKGIKVMVMVSTLEDALSVAQSGPDLIVAQGSEAGGHRSTWEKKATNEHAAIGTLPLLTQIVGNLQIPVIAAGGIVNGKGILAALSLGAQGVLMGTRFIATQESMAPEFYKKKILEESGDHTTVTDVFTGMYARVLRNTFTEGYRLSGAPVLPPGSQYIATRDVVNASELQEKSEYYNLYAGQGVGEIKEILSVKEVLDRLIEETLFAYEQLVLRMNKEGK